MKKIKIVPMMLTACLLAGCNPNTTSSDITNTDTSSGTTSSTPTPTKGEILSFDVNESYKEYKSVQLDKIDDIQKDGGDNSKYKRTSFFENKDGGKDTYKVGSANAFKVECKGSFLDSTGTLVYSTIDEINHKLLIKNTAGEYVDVTSEESTYVSVLNNEFDFTDAAVGHEFKLTLSPDANKYTGNYEDSMEFEVVNAWNVYNALDLAYLDNVDPTSDLISEDDRNNHDTFIMDVWKDVRDIEIANSIQGIVLQNDINVTSEDLPDYLKWSSEEVDTYRKQNESDFTTWSKNLFKTYEDENGNSKERTDEECYALGKEKLQGSLKDFVNVYSRITELDETFTIEGNYFNLDVTGIKKIVKFGDKSLVQAASSNGSHSQLLAFPGDGGYGHDSFGVGIPFQFRNQDGEIIINNMNIKGNGTRDNSSENLGGIICIKSNSSNFVATNVNSSDTFITIFTRPCYDSDTPSKSTIDRSRWYDSYSSMLFFYRSQNNYITNSIMIGAGGSLMLLSEIDNEYPASCDVSNSYLESYVNGQESWFVDKNAQTYVPMIAQYQLGILNTLANQYGITEQSSYVKVQDGKPYVNLLAIHLDGDNPFGNTLAGGHQLVGHLNIDDNSLVNYDELYQPTGSLYPYVATAQALGAQGMIFKSSTGASSMAGDTTGTEMFYYSKVFASLPEANKTAITQAFASQSAQLGQLVGAGMFPASYSHDLISPALTAQGAGIVADDIDNNWKQLVQGDYLTLNLQVTTTTHYFGLVLGY